ARLRAEDVASRGGRWSGSGGAATISSTPAPSAALRSNRAAKHRRAGEFLEAPTSIDSTLCPAGSVPLLQRCWPCGPPALGNETGSSCSFKAIALRDARRL